MALPSLRKYYLSAQLRPLVYWCNPSYVAKWKTMGLSISDSPIQSLLGFVDKENEIIQVEDQWVNLSPKIWTEVVKCFQLQRDIKLLRWPAYDPDFIPALQDHRYRQWVYYGITAICKTAETGEFKSFNNLCQTYGLGRQDFYRYLQLRDYFL